MAGRCESRQQSREFLLLVHAEVGEDIVLVLADRAENLLMKPTTRAGDGDVPDTSISGPGAASHEAALFQGVDEVQRLLALDAEEGREFALRHRFPPAQGGQQAQPGRGEPGGRQNFSERATEGVSYPVQQEAETSDPWAGR